MTERKTDRIIRETRERIDVIIDRLNEEFAACSKVYPAEDTAKLKEKTEAIVGAWRYISDTFAQTDPEAILEYEDHWLDIMQQAVSQMTKYDFNETIASWRYGNKARVINGTGRIIAITEYNKDFVDKAHELGGKWNAAGKFWSFDPESEDAVREAIAEIYA